MDLAHAPVRRPTRSSGDRAVRSWLFRPEARAGVREVMVYLASRAAEPDPWQWPRKPNPSLIGVKNLVKRLTYDLSVYGELTGRDVDESVITLDLGLVELDHFLKLSPPAHLQHSLGAPLIQAFLLLHQRAWSAIPWEPAMLVKNQPRGNDLTRFGEHTLQEEQNDALSIEEMLLSGNCTRDRLFFACSSWRETISTRTRMIELERHRETVVQSPVCGFFITLLDIGHIFNPRKWFNRLDSHDFSAPHSSPRLGVLKR
ncbi:hypothetical protein PYCC9005_004206 [Savitreella phatthalungensis]